MTKRLKSLKLWPLYVAFSAVVIIAGIVLFALFGFNTAPEKPQYKTFEVRYNVVAVINDKEEEIQSRCEEAFEEKNLVYTEKRVQDEVSATNNMKTGSKRLVYEFPFDTSDETLALAKAAAETKLVFESLAVESSVSVNTVKGETFYEAGWRAAVGIAVGAVVALVYIGIRFGLGSALSGLVGTVNAAVFTFAFFAVTRIPVFAAGPLLYAAVAAISFVLMYLLHCMKMRENFKDPAFEKFTSDEALIESLKTSDKFVYWTAGALGAVVLVLGAVATAGVRMLALPALVAVAAALYSASLFAPAVHLYCKRAFDKIKKNKIRKYSGKKKAVKNEEAEQISD